MPGAKHGRAMRAPTVGRGFLDAPSSHRLNIMKFRSTRRVKDAAPYAILSKYA